MAGALAGTMFQFHKVRLKVRKKDEQIDRLTVSIPQGTIKRRSRKLPERSEDKVSIPQGTIKRRYDIRDISSIN